MKGAGLPFTRPMGAVLLCWDCRTEWLKLCDVEWRILL